MIDKSKYPKATKVLGEWILKKAKLYGQSAEVLQQVPVENMVDMVLGADGRVLYEFLDDYHLQCGVICMADGQWKWRVNDIHPMEGFATSRVEAESKVYNEGLLRLEQRL